MGDGRLRIGCLWYPGVVKGIARCGFAMPMFVIKGGGVEGKSAYVGRAFYTTNPNVSQ